jgi:hypothetical protein
MPKSNQPQSSGSRRQPQSSRSASSGGRSSEAKIDNILYNVITVLHVKSKGLEAYEQYEQDLQGNDEIREIFEEIRKNDEQAVQQLKDCLRQLILESAEGERGSEEEEEAA